MLPVIQKPPLTRSQKRAAIAVAAVIDFLQITLLPALLPGYLLDDVLDVIAAIILVAICGFKWQFMLAFAMELLPIVDIFPTWTAVVLTLPSHDPAVATPHRDMIDVKAIPVSPAHTAAPHPTPPQSA